MRQQRQELIDFHDSIPELDLLPKFPEDAGDIENEFARAIGTETVLDGRGKQGLAAIYETVFGPVEKGSDDSSRVFRFVHRIAVLENPLINRSVISGTLITYEEMVEILVRNTTGIFRPTVATSPLVLDDEGIQKIKGVTKEGQELIGKQVTFFCFGGLAAPDMATVEVPVITQDPVTLEVTITCGTPGAAIFYTVDGSRPRPGKTLYTAPFTPAAGVLLAARAVLAGCLQPVPDRNAIATLQT